MAHFAEIDKNNVVLRVLVVEDQFQEDGQNYLANVVGLGGTWIQTSYNSLGGVHYLPTGEPSGKPHMRFNFAGIGHIYDPEGDAFYQPQPYPSWTLNKDTYVWEAPTPKPSATFWGYWDEDTKSWIEYIG